MTALVPLFLGALLAWSGAAKLLSAPDPDGAPAKVFRRYARPVLVTLGAVELAVAGLLLVRPLATAGGVAAAILGVGFLGYLGWAKAAAPGSSCGCTGSSRAPIGPRSYARAWVVVVGGAVALEADRPWWTVAADRPGAAVAATVAALVLVGALFAEESWLLPLRRWRLRVSPVHGPGDGSVPVAATVELLERSLAWETAAPVVRSALLESWDDGGWRLLRFAGVEDGRPVTVLFALDATATLDTTAEPAVRMSVLDEAALVA